MGSIDAAGCGVMADSSSSSAIYLNSGTISATTLAAVGAFAEWNSGSNTVSAGSVEDGAAAEGDPLVDATIPAATSCDFTNEDFTSWSATPYSFSPDSNSNVFCKDTRIGGNDSSDVFAQGVCYVENGNLTFLNADITLASGVTFILDGATLRVCLIHKQLERRRIDSADDRSDGGHRDLPGVWFRSKRHLQRRRRCLGVGVGGRLVCRAFAQRRHTAHRQSGGSIERHRGDDQCSRIR